MGGYGSATRLSLVGSRGPQSLTFAKDVDSLIFSEIIEFALSLAPAVKGQEPYMGLPHLQAYRFIRATSLAEIGDINLAHRFVISIRLPYSHSFTHSMTRYCDSITTSLARPSPYFTTALLEQLKGLSDRINGVSHGDKSGSWIGGKISKPSLDTIGGWLEGRFTKLVTGDTDGVSDNQEEHLKKAEAHPFSGPFSHYSTISTTPSARSSPQPMVSNDSYSPGNIQNPSEGLQTPRPSADVGGVSREATWWGSNSYADGSSVQTPTASSFSPASHAVPASSSEGYISPVDTNPRANETRSWNENSMRSVVDEEDVEDLGFGNSKQNKEKLEDKPTPAANATLSRMPIPEKSDIPQQKGKQFEFLPHNML